MNKTSNNLAIFGNPPTFKRKLVVGLPNIGDRKRLFKRINAIFDARRLTNDGPFLQEFEERVADFLQVKHCIAVNNATLGIQLVSKALGLHGEVIVTPFTFIASAHALEWVGIKPVFCDADPETHNISPAQVEKSITSNTTGIMGVHVWGRACEVDALSEIAKRHNIKIFYDAAHAFGSSQNGMMIGNFGDAEIFSFHATKYLNTLEGGAITTNNDDLALRLRMLRNFGFLDGAYAYSAGTNGKMNEISAAMGLTLLEEIDDLIARNYATYKQYQLNLRGIPGIKLVEYDEEEKNNYQYIVIEIDESVIHLSRDEIVDILDAENVYCKKYFSPGCHRMEPYRSLHPDITMPVADQLSDRICSLPGGPTVSPDDVKRICQIIRQVVEDGEAIHVRLQSRYLGEIKLDNSFIDLAHL